MAEKNAHVPVTISALSISAAPYRTADIPFTSALPVSKSRPSHNTSPTAPSFTTVSTYMLCGNTVTTPSSSGTYRLQYPPSPRPAGHLSATEASAAFHTLRRQADVTSSVGFVNAVIRSPTYPVRFGFDEATMPRASARTSVDAARAAHLRCGDRCPDNARTRSVTAVANQTER